MRFVSFSFLSNLANIGKNCLGLEIRISESKSLFCIIAPERAQMCPL